MPKFYVAFNKVNGNPDAVALKNIVNPSFTLLKAQLKDFPNTHWTIAKFEIKPDVESICKLVENGIDNIPPLETEKYRINAQGQCRRDP